MVTITQTPTSVKFQKAWEYVDRNYAHLIRELSLRSISLLPDNHSLWQGSNQRAGGLHQWDGMGTISVRFRPHFNTAHYIEILVHELTHLVQCSSGRAYGMTEAQLEAEAYPAGWNAKHLYELQEFEGIASEMKAAAAVAAIQRRWAA